MNCSVKEFRCSQPIRCALRFGEGGKSCPLHIWNWRCPRRVQIGSANDKGGGSPRFIGRPWGGFLWPRLKAIVRRTLFLGELPRRGHRVMCVDVAVRRSRFALAFSQAARISPSFRPDLRKPHSAVSVQKLSRGGCSALATCHASESDHHELTLTPTQIRCGPSTSSPRRRPRFDNTATSPREPIGNAVSGAGHAGRGHSPAAHCCSSMRAHYWCAGRSAVPLRQKNPPSCGCTCAHLDSLQTGVH